MTLGIRTPSLYNHFKSKDDILQAAYQYLRERAQERMQLQDAKFGARADGTLEETLLRSFEQYSSFVLDADLLRFFKVLYAERVRSPVAARVMVDETEHMVRQVKALFYDLVAHGRMRADDVDMAALSFAMTVHALVDHQMDVLTCGQLSVEGTDMPLFDEVRTYISWFARQMEPRHE